MLADTRPPHVSCQQGARLHSHHGVQEEAPAQHHLQRASGAMGPRAQLSDNHGQLGALCQVNASVLASGGHELFLGRDSANFLTLGMGRGRGSCWGPCRLPASLSLEGARDISPNQ